MLGTHLAGKVVECKYSTLNLDHLRICLIRSSSVHKVRVSYVRYLNNWAYCISNIKVGKSMQSSYSYTHKT